MAAPDIASKSVGMLIFDGITALDLIGPMEPLSLVPGWSVELIAESVAPVRSANGLMLHPDRDLRTASQYDIFVVPGGPGVDAAIGKRTIVDLVRNQSEVAAAVFGICTGSLLLGAAGMLRGRRANCHWQATDFLTDFGAEPTRQRTTVDGKYFTSGGVTAGIDMALELIGDLVDEATAQRIQLLLEYDPKPPFDAGRPDVAPRAVVDALQHMSRERYASRKEAVAAPATRMDA